MEGHLNHSRNRNQEGGVRRARANDQNVRTSAEAELDNWLIQMRRKADKTPILLRDKAGNRSCCIFRVPQSLVEINEKAYQPRIVSIGPYHHGLEHLQMIEEHKWRFLGALLDRKQDPNILTECFQTIASLEMEIRECYSEINRFSSHEFVEMILLDGCFIIELVCKVTGLVSIDHDDPIFKMDWILPFLMRDLLKLENQIPFFVLQRLFDILVLDSEVSLASRTLKFFSNHVLERPPSVVSRAGNHDGKHLLDLVRLSFRPSFTQERAINRRRDKFLMSIQPAEKLHRAGIQFKTRKNKDSFLDIKFSNGVLRIPPLPLDDFVSSFFLNCVAFEQCYGHCPKFITDYATFMGCLILTKSDAGFLCDHKIIENCYGTDEEVACFFTNVGKDVAFDIEKSYLSKLIEDVNEYYWNDWHVRWASFKNKYFDTPWSFMSASAALMLLILTSIQAFFAWYSYVHPSNNNN